MGTDNLVGATLSLVHSIRDLSYPHGFTHITFARACGPNEHETMSHHRGFIELDALTQETCGDMQGAQRSEPKLRFWLPH